MKGKGLTIAIVIIFIAGLSFLLYPFVSNYVNSLHQAQSIVNYDKDVGGLDNEANNRLLAEAREWNATYFREQLYCWYKRRSPSLSVV